jgi:hypothetical protein
MKWWLVGLAILAVVIVLLRVATARRARRLAQPAEILPPGWQFTLKPTASALEGPGTVFRIDHQKRRYLVERLGVPVSRAREAASRSEAVIETQMAVVARFLGLKAADLGGSASFRQKLELELINPEREATTDADVDPILDDFKQRLKYRADNRYFIIRDTRLVSGMVYRLSRQQADALSGLAEAGQSALNARGSIRQGNSYEVRQNFPEPMQVMFLAEEMGPVKAGFGGGRPELGIFPVTEVLEFTDDGTGLMEPNP